MRPDSRSLWAGAGLVLLCLLAYLPAIEGDFIWDDDAYVVDNETLESADGLRRIWFEVGATPQYYPLVFTSFWIERYLWGLHPEGYHLVNILLHALAAVLAWRVLRLLEVRGAWLGAALFALHPVHVESVAWITERKNVLSGALYLGAGLLLLQLLLGPELHRRSWWSRYLVSLLLFVGALTSKTVTATLPAAVVLVLWWKARDLGWRRLIPVAPFFAVSVGFGLLTVWVEKFLVGARGEGWDHSLVERALIAGRALWFYAGKLAWPSRLTFVYPRWQISAVDPTLWGFFAGAVAVVATLWVLRRRWGRGPLVAVLFFAGTLVPALGFFDVYPMRFSFVADHFQYLASLGLLTLAAVALADLSIRVGSRPGVLVQMAVLAVLALLTLRQTRIYGDLETLWRDTLEKNPEAWMAHQNLGLLLQERGDVDGAIASYRRALDLKPDYPLALSNLAVALKAEGRLEEAIRQYRRAAELEPAFADAHYNLAIALQESGAVAEAIPYYQRALELQPTNPKFHNNYGNALAALDREAEAATHYRRALELDPDFLGARLNLGASLGALGNWAAAASEYELVLEHEPGRADVLDRLGRARGRAGNLDGAVDAFERAIAVDPAYHDAQFNLAAALTALGRHEEAATRLRLLVQSAPEDAEAHTALGAALERTGQPRAAAAAYRRALELRSGDRDAEQGLLRTTRPQVRGAIEH